MASKFKRTESLFSLCGLNCGLCPMHVTGQCSGCFTDSPCYPTCPIAPCSVKHGNVEYCYQCKEYPCKRYDDIDKYSQIFVQPSSPYRSLRLCIPVCTKICECFFSYMMHHA